MPALDIWATPPPGLLGGAHRILESNLLHSESADLNVHLQNTISEIPSVRPGSRAPRQSEAAGPWGLGDLGVRLGSALRQAWGRMEMAGEASVCTNSVLRR